MDPKLVGSKARAAGKKSRSYTAEQKVARSTEKREQQRERQSGEQQSGEQQSGETKQ